MVNILDVMMGVSLNVTGISIACAKMNTEMVTKKTAIHNLIKVLKDKKSNAPKGVSR